MQISEGKNTESLDKNMRNKSPKKIKEKIEALDPLSKAAFQSTSDKEEFSQKHQSSTKQVVDPSNEKNVNLLARKVLKSSTIVNKKTKELSLIEDEFEGKFEDELSQGEIADMQNIKNALETIKNRK